MLQSSNPRQVEQSDSPPVHRAAARPFLYDPRIDRTTRFGNSIYAPPVLEIPPKPSTHLLSNAEVALSPISIVNQV